MNNQHQQPLFHEDLNDALGYLVSALGGNKKVGHDMWPAMSPDKAGRKLCDCLNDSHAQKLSPDDFLWLLKEGRRAGVHSALAYILAECGYEEPKPIAPREMAKDEINQVQQLLAALTPHLDRLAHLEKLLESDDRRSGDRRLGAV